MRIFLISNMYPSKNDSLFGIFVKNFKIGLQKQGVLFTRTSLIKGKASSISHKSWKYIQHYYSCFKNYFSKDYDIIYVHFLTHHIPILYLFNLKKNKVVINSHGSDIIKLQKNSFQNYFAKKVLEKASLIVVPTSYFKEKVLEYYPNLNAENIFISPSAGIDSQKFYFKTNKSFNKEELTLGFVSRFIEEKGWNTFLEALLTLKTLKIPFKAIIAGKGPDEQKILSFIKTHDLYKEVNFIGLVEQKKLIDLYSAFDLYIFPTYREAESLGLTGLESMTCGTPVISCNISGPKTYINHQENGFLFSPKNTQELVNLIVLYYNLSSEEKQNMSENALKTAKNYDSMVVTKKLYKKLVSLDREMD